MLSLSEAPAMLIAQRFAPRPVSAITPEDRKLSLKARIAALPWHGTQRGEKTMLSLSEAATAAELQSRQFGERSRRAAFPRPKLKWEPIKSTRLNCSECFLQRQNTVI